MIVEKSHFKNYVIKAGEFYNSMKANMESGRWDAAAIDAIHCAISSNDALTIFHLGRKHQGQKHSDSVKLLREIDGISRDVIKEKENQLRDILDSKTPVEYSDQLYTEGQAGAICKKAERFFEWVSQALPKVA